MSQSNATVDARRALTRSHYDRYPFRFDQRFILEEKMEHRLMGEAIREIEVPDAIVLDVGSGACRVAHMVRQAKKGRAVSIDLSRQTLRSAMSHNPDPVLNGDNMRLPIRSGVGDLVISNGVIMVTPDARTSFGELVRVTRPGGILIVSVYDRNSWYYPVYRYGGALVRASQRRFGDAVLRFTLFPVFHVAVLAMMAVVARRPVGMPIEISWNLFHDQFTTPHCTFHRAEEMRDWAREEGMVCESVQSEAARQLVTLRLRKPPVI